MIKRLKVKFVRTDFEFTCNTFEEAVNVTSCSDRSKLAREQNKIFSKLKIVDFKIYMNRVAFFLSDGKVLEITSYEKYGDWKVLSEESQDEIPQDYADEVHLIEVRESGSDLNVFWKPYELLKSRLGIAGFGVYPSQTMVYLHVKGFDELMFGQIIDSEGNLRIDFHNE